MELNKCDGNCGYAATFGDAPNEKEFCEMVSKCICDLEECPLKSGV
jgi:hypothetical protein